MQSTTLPLTRDLVLVGGGHTHALVLRKWAMRPLPGVRVTLISPGPTAPYSGMLPGYIAGHYQRSALDIDLVQLARRAGARLVLDAATGIDREARQIVVGGHPPVGFDVASLDIGITSAMPDLPGFSEHAVPAKPLDAFARAWRAFCEGTGRARIVVIGAGVAGAEIAMAMAHAMRLTERAAEIVLLDRGTAFNALGAGAAARLRSALRDNGVDLREQARPVAVTSESVALEDGTHIAADFVTGAAGARPYSWLSASGLTDAEGFVPVDDRLRSRDGAIFAVGDCAEMTAAPRPKAGVYAVRQAPVLFGNLRAALTGTGGLRAYTPQRDYLKLISLGGKSALAERFGTALSGPALWRWKDRIDRRFMDQFRHWPVAQPPALPWPRAQGADEVAASPLCGGCGAKVGQGVLTRALAQKAPGDDAAIVQVGDVQQVLSTDHLRAFSQDPVTVTRIAAVHALGDIWAMGARPDTALVQIVLPRQSPQMAERALAEIMSAAHATFAEAGAEIVGGHTTQGSELIVGFTVTGTCLRKPITQAGAVAGDALVLTKPIGSGVVLAAEMQAHASGKDVVGAYRSMSQPQGAAAEILAQAHAMTDVTGFGLAGHLRALCTASGVGAELWSGRVPLLPGAPDLAARGVRSSLWTENRDGFADVPEGPVRDLMFDPQTGGGLLAAVSADGTPELAALIAAGYDAAVIGRVTDTGVVSIL
ncbi:MAG: selenide, water dikinase SelD [Pseudomonadota bacterium]